MALSGAQRRKLRQAKGLPKYTDSELAAKRADDKRRTQARATTALGWLAQYKVETGCADCSYSAHHAALDFDHLPGYLKRRVLSGMHLYSKDALLAEIAKCEVVCANCHRIRTYERRKNTQPSLF